MNYCTQFLNVSNISCFNAKSMEFGFGTTIILNERVLFLLMLNSCIKYGGTNAFMILYAINQAYKLRRFSNGIRFDNERCYIIIFV